MGFLRGPTNFVQDMLHSNCQRPFYIYVLTALPCIIEAVITLRLFDMDDLVRKTAQEAARGGGTPRRGLRHGVSKTTRQSPGSRRERYYKNGLKHLLALTQPLEHIGFALLLYGVVDRFYANWMMYLDDADACIRPQFYGPLIRRTTDGDAHPNAGGNAIQLPELVCDNGNWGSSPLTASVPIGRYRAVFAATITGPGGGAAYQLEIRAFGVIGTGVFTSAPVECAEGSETDIIIDADLFFPLVSGGEVQWIIKGPPVPVGLRIPKADIYIQRLATALD